MGLVMRVCTRASTCSTSAPSSWWGARPRCGPTSGCGPPTSARPTIPRRPATPATARRVGGAAGTAWLTWPRAVPPVLELRRVHAAYGQIEVLHGIDLAVTTGAVLALLGPNGAGKSTTLKVASGQMEPTKGCFHVLGRHVNGMRPDKLARAGLCTLPDGRGIFPNLTVIGEPAPDDVRRARPASHVEEHGLRAASPAWPSAATRWPGTLSGGEQQMLAMARTLSVEPAVLLLDEISMGLAPMIVAELYELVAPDRRRGRRGHPGRAVRRHRARRRHRRRRRRPGPHRGRGQAGRPARRPGRRLPRRCRRMSPATAGRHRSPAPRSPACSLAGALRLLVAAARGLLAAALPTRAGAAPTARWAASPSPRWPRRSRRSTSSPTSPSRPRRRSSSTRATPSTIGQLRPDRHGHRLEPLPGPGGGQRRPRARAPGARRARCPRRRSGRSRPPASTRRRPTPRSTDEPGVNMDAPSTTNGNTASATLGDDAPTAGSSGATPTQRRRRARATRSPAPPPLIGVGNMSATSSSQAPSIDGHAPTPRATDSGVSMLGGFITIGSVTSTATASSDGTTGKVTGSTQVQNMSIAGAAGDRRRQRHPGRRQGRPAVAARSRRINTLLKRARHLHLGDQRHRQGQRPLGQPHARRPQDHHRPQDARHRGQPVRLAAPASLTSQLPGRHPQRPAAHARLGHRAGELHRLAAVRRRERGQQRRRASAASTSSSTGSGVHARPTPGSGSFAGDAGRAASSPAAPRGDRPAARRLGVHGGGPGSAARRRRRPPTSTITPAFKGIGAALVLLGLLAAAALAYAYKRADDASELLGATSCATATRSWSASAATPTTSPTSEDSR